MAIAWTAVINKATVFGDQRVFYVTLTAPASCTYTTGGDTIAPSLVGLDYIDFVNVNFAFPTAATTGLIPNITVNGDGNAKLQLFATGAGNEDVFPELTSAATTAESFIIQAQFFGV